jgi:hypothetical protein
MLSDGYNLPGSLFAKLVYQQGFSFGESKVVFYIAGFEHVWPTESVHSTRF